MIMPSANLMENPLKSHKYGKSYHLPNAKGLPFAFLFSLVIYISIFYTFSLSPSTLFSNPKFWFAISNTLILIIAADSGAFASSKDRKLDLYEEYALHGQARRTHRHSTAVPVPVPVPSFVSQYPGIVKEEADVVDQKENEIPVRILDDKLQQQHPMKADDEACDHQGSKPVTIRRSKSAKVKRVACPGRKNSLQRSKTERLDEPVGKDQNEFSTMSDEELNRRVEEFIQKFNTQIRLQRC